LITKPYRADPSGKISAGKSYVVFGKKDNTNAIELSAIAAGVLFAKYNIRFATTQIGLMSPHNQII
jgi:hypothetical protein